MGDDLDPLDDIFSGEEMKTVKAAGKFQPKPKFRPAKRSPAAPPVSLSQAEVQTTDSVESELKEPVETSQSSEQNPDVVPYSGGDRLASIEKSVGESAGVIIEIETLGDILDDTGKNKLPENVAEGSADLDPLTGGEPIVSSSDGRSHMHNTEEIDVMDSINLSEITTKPGQRKGKFQPKPKIQMRKEKETCEASNKPVSHSLDSQSVPPDINYVEKDVSSTFQQDDVVGLSSLEFTHMSPAEVNAELPLNEESMNHIEMTQLGMVIHEGEPEVPTKLASRRAKTRRGKTDTSASSQENETGTILRSRKGKNNLRGQEDETGDGVLANGEYPEEYPPNSALEEENIDNEGQVGSESPKKKAKRNSKKNNGDKEKPTRKRKAKEASDKDAVAKPKKFSHSTRRRRVDKALLETPEDEIDYQKVPLRDLILLAEHKEKLMKKDEAAAGATAAAAATIQSNGNCSSLYNEDNPFTSNQDEEHNDEQGSPKFEETNVYINYQTYMDKTPSTRWSKQDTELFYEAVRQFGTDLSMIQQLFPDRTRRQVKLKYKKEERQHPLRLRDALTNRPKDMSHFERVIERLHKIAAENQNDDDFVDLSDNEAAAEDDEGTSKAENKESKDEQVEKEEENEDVVHESTEAQSPLKFDDDDDDDADEIDFWTNYKSEA